MGARNRRWLWLLPPLFAIWANCHGSYFFGLGVLGVYSLCSFLKGKWGLITVGRWSGPDRKQLGIVLSLSVLALLSNPVGWKLLTYPLNTLFHQTTGLAAVVEWQAPSLQWPRTLTMLTVAIALLLMALLRRSELLLRDLIVTGTGLYLATQHTRMMFLFGIVISPLLCRILAPVLGKESTREHPGLNALLIAGFAAVIVAVFPSRGGIEQQIRKTSPVGAVEYVRRAGLTGPMLNEYVFGGYLIWTMPEHSVFIDGRGDIYDWTGVFAEYGRWMGLTEDPKILLDRYGIRFCLLAQDSPLGRVIPYLGWKKTYSDDVAAVFTR